MAQGQPGFAGSSNAAASGSGDSHDPSNLVSDRRGPTLRHGFGLAGAGQKPLTTPAVFQKWRDRQGRLLLLDRPHASQRGMGLSILTNEFSTGRGLSEE